MLYCALIGYIHYEAPVEEQNFSTLIEFINAMEVREDDEEFKNPVDLMFDALEAEKPNHFAVRQYKKYKLAAGKMRRLLLSAKEVITSDALIFYTQKRRKRRRYGMNSYNIGLEDRKIIEEMYNAGAKPCEIAARIGKCQATIYREIKRGEVPELNARCRPAYRAEVAEKRVTEAYRKRGRRKATE